MTTAFVDLPGEGEPELERRMPGERRSGVPRQRQEGQVTWLATAPWPAVEDLEQPPAPASAPSPAGPVVARPVYDPFSARRRRTPEWLVGYRAAVVTCDVLAVVGAYEMAPAFPISPAVYD